MIFAENSRIYLPFSAVDTAAVAGGAIGDKPLPSSMAVDKTRVVRHFPTGLSRLRGRPWSATSCPPVSALEDLFQRVCATLTCKRSATTVLTVMG